MKLVLAEKPSVAQSIAKVLGAAKREDGYLEGNGYVVSWCVGHLVELAQPEVYDAKYSKWAYADLPIFPMDWQYEVSAGTKKQFGILKKLMAREDVASLVCATDAGREGELIFRLVYHKAGCRKPFERLWISSMEDVAIKEGFENLRSGTEYDALYEAALCRERADWIVGIEIYVDGIATMQIQNLNSLVDTVRHEIIERYRPGEDDPHLKVLQAAHISDDEYFSHMVLDDLNLIIRDIREAHKKDSESAPQTTVADELKENLEAVENFKGSRDEKLVVLYCKQLGINYKNLSDEEFRWLIRILKKSKKMGTPISQRKKR